MKNKIFVTFLFSLLFVSLTQAQWWVSGGNLLWPYGSVTVKDSLSVEGNASIDSVLTVDSLSVEGNANFDGTLTAYDLSVTSDIFLTGNLDVGGNITTSGTINGVKYYTALLSFSGSDPTVIELENTLGISLNWRKDATGRYSADFGDYIDPTKLFVNAQRFCYDASGGNFRVLNYSIQALLLSIREDYEDMEYWAGATINYDGTPYYPIQLILYP